MVQVDLTLLGVKLIMGSSMFIVGFCCGVAPIGIENFSSRTRDRFLSAANCFAAGIFLATGFLHMFSEGLVIFGDYGVLKSYEDDIKMAMVLCAVGFYFTFIVDKVIFLGSSHGHSHGSRDHKDELQSHNEVPHDHDHDHDHGHDGHGDERLSHANEQFLNGDAAINPPSESQRSQASHKQRPKNKGGKISIANNVQIEDSLQYGSFSNSGEIPIASPKNSSSSSSASPSTSSEAVLVVNVEGHKSAKAVSSTGLSFPKKSRDGKPTLVNYVLIFVLSIHSSLAGFVLGLSGSVDVALPIFFALLAHHWIESFALGVSLLRTNVSNNHLVVMITFFSCMVPIGIVLGFSLRFFIDEEASDMAEAFFLAVAAGSFIYVAVVDILLEEFHVAQDKYKKSLMFLLGFALNAGLTFYFEG